MGTNSRVEEELMRMEREFGEAQTRHDLARLEQLMADDFIATNNLGQVIGKGLVLKDLASPDYDLESLVNNEIEIRIFGETAVATARGVAKGRYKGKDASGEFRYTRVWVRRGGRWQAVAAQSTMIARP